MCWIGENVKQIAEKDIPVFKICYLIKGQIISLYQTQLYNLNMPYYSEIHIEEAGMIHYKITEGLHSYHPNVRIRRVNKEYAIYGLHGSMMCTAGPNVIKVVGYISKGSVYYLNYRGEYVSDKLVLTKIVHTYD